VKYRSEKGLWYQIVDQAERIGNYEESSVSTMVTYFLAKGYNLGVLSEVSGRIALESYTAIVDDFVLVDREGQHHLTQVCQVGGLGYGRDGSYEYYMSEPVVNNDPKGLGPYIMLGRQIEQLQNSLN
jgi:unsaturated rhamnogalacturonyl hydrolase